jgi:hypothetical protein
MYGLGRVERSKWAADSLRLSPISFMTIDPYRSGLVQTEKRKNEHDDDDQADEVNDSIHDCLRTSRPNIDVNKFPRA